MDNENALTNEKRKKGNPNLYRGIQSFNPNGRPKGSLSYSTLLRKAVKRINQETGSKITEPEIEIIKAVFLKATREKNTTLLIDIQNRLFGVPKPEQQEKQIVPIIILPANLVNKYNTQD
jgi:hypothetical protein